MGFTMASTPSLFLDALRCRNMGRPPVWIMRQAGRYMASYRAIRSKHSFLEMCHHPELIAEVTLLPIRQFGFDAAILFSDILVIPEALGLGLHFEEGKGPIIQRPICSREDIKRLGTPNIASLDYVRKGIEILKKELKIPLIGFCGAPFTVASYMIEGGSSRDLKKTKQWMLSDSTSFHQLLKIIADWSIAYLRMQIRAGVEAVQIFDSWANYLAHHQFREYSLAYLKYILNGLKETKVPNILFCKGSSVFASQLSEINPSGIGLDWNCDITQMRTIVPKNIALQGNLDPDILYAPKEVIRGEVTRILEGMKGDPGYIFNLGHGIHPDIPEEAVRFLVETIKCQNISSS
jgi:uroporphyrinogen decarboxylase